MFSLVWWGGIGWGGGGYWETNFKLLILSPNLLKTKFLYVQWGGVGWSLGDKLPTFDAESKSVKNQIFL